MKEIIRYETKDGKVHDTKEQAEDHEHTAEIIDFLDHNDNLYMGNDGSTTREIVLALKKYYTITRKV